MPLLQVTYPPLDVPKPVTTDVWIVDGGPIAAFGMALPVRMTVVRLANGDLLLHSPTRWSPQLATALEQLGPIRHLVLPNIAHWMFARAWQTHHPDAITWGAPGLEHRAQVRAAGCQVDRVLQDGSPAAWAGAVEAVTVRGGLGFVEVALFHGPSRTLLLTDIVQGLEPAKLHPVARVLLRALGGAGPDARPPVYLRAAVKLGGAAARRAAERLITLAPARVIFTHGAWFAADGTARLRRSLGWLVG